MSTSVVFAAAQCSVRFGGLIIRLTPGDAWDANDPFVKHRPDLFAARPAHINRTGPAPVEQATANPGERRTTRRG